MNFTLKWSPDFFTDLWCCMKYKYAFWKPYIHVSTHRWFHVNLSGSEQVPAPIYLLFSNYFSALNCPSEIEVMLSYFRTICGNSDTDVQTLTPQENWYFCIFWGVPERRLHNSTVIVLSLGNSMSSNLPSYNSFAVERADAGTLRRLKDDDQKFPRPIRSLQTVSTCYCHFTVQVITEIYQSQNLTAEKKYLQTESKI